MSVETLSLYVSVATLVVIAATAIAAIGQLRHLRAAYQIDALFHILEEWNDPTLRKAYSLLDELPALLEDPAYVRVVRAGATDRGAYPEMLVLDFWEQIGTYTKRGLIDEATLLDISSTTVLSAWRKASKLIAVVREVAGPSADENFEYLAVRSALWIQRYPDGNYPAKLPRMEELERRNAETLARADEKDGST